MIRIDPAHPHFTRLPRKDRARIYAEHNWKTSAIADELGAHVNTVQMWLNPERWERRKAYLRTVKQGPEQRQKYNEWRRQYRAALRQHQGAAE